MFDKIETSSLTSQAILTTASQNKEHLESVDLNFVLPSSHILKQLLESHEGETFDEIDFRVKGLSYYR